MSKQRAANEKVLLLNSDEEVMLKRRSQKCCLHFLLIALAAATLVLLLAVSINLVFLAANKPTYVVNAGTFRAGAFECKLVNVDNASTREEALQAIRGNIARLEKKAKVANDFGVNVLVFAEYGLTGNMGPAIHNRSSVYPYMEEIPAVSDSNPFCVSCGGDITPGHEGQTAVGCIASKYGMYVVGNLIESVPCDSKLDSRCPADGHYQYNTNIVYDPKGCLIAKYHKYHRYAEEFQRLDRPAQPEFIYFDSEYGRFGTMICMDAMFEDPGITLAKKYNIDHMLFPTYWDNGKDYAVESAVSWQIAYATVANVNFIGANVHAKKDFAYGSSILSGQEVVNFTFTNNDIHGKLIIGDLPTTKPRRKQNILSINSNNFPKQIVPKVETAEIYGDIYSVAVLDGLTGSIKVCQKTLCCSLQYKRNSTEETFVLGAFKGIHTLEEAIANEICIVLKCANSSLASCKERESVSFTSFPLFELSAQFGVEYVYPSLTPSNLEFKRLDFTYQHNDKDFHNSISSDSEWPWVYVALVGRDFKHDPQI